VQSDALVCMRMYCVDTQTNIVSDRIEHCIQGGVYQFMHELHALQKVHIAHVNIDGMVELPRYKAMMPDKPDGFFLKPVAIAETYWALHEQDPSAWTHELDLRPAIEKW